MSEIDIFEDEDRYRHRDIENSGYHPVDVQ